jgi:GT2 family glycosyltransferase
MENKNTISVVLPLKTRTAYDFESFFEKSIESLKNQKDEFDELVIVHCDESQLESYLTEFDFGGINVKFEKWTEEPNYSKQVNRGVEVSSSNWVSLLEFDDEYSKIWFRNSKKYMDIYKDVDAFLPIVVDVDDKAVFAGFTNEATFAANITNEIGILSNDILQNFQNFQISGMIISKERFLNVGGLKSNIKLTFGYEFFLRLTHNSARIMTIPKIGYKHMNLRLGSLFWNYKNSDDRLSADEVKFWIDSAKKEYFYNVEREINYEHQEV